MKSNKPSKLMFKKLTLRVLTQSEQGQIVGGDRTATVTEWDGFSCVWGCGPSGLCPSQVPACVTQVGCPEPTLVF
jgi:hypothetical protein